MVRPLNTGSLNAWTVLPLRLVGHGFAAHGVAKWQRGPDNFGKLLHQIGAPFPTATAWAVKGMEVLGGVAIMYIAALLVLFVDRWLARQTSRSPR
jgi:putative oxidoreductase